MAVLVSELYGLYIIQDPAILSGSAQTRSALKVLLHYLVNTDLFC